MMVVAGGASGADEIARQWAVERKVDHQILYAKWGLQGKAAGPIRNRRMLSKKPKEVVAFHENIAESRGTADMVAVARKAGVKVKVYR